MLVFVIPMSDDVGGIGTKRNLYASDVRYLTPFEMTKFSLLDH